MYLAYLDDSDTRAKAEHWKVVCAAMVSDDAFSAVELISSIAIENLMPEDKRSDFLEFHACELYGGYGPFEGIEQRKRFEAIESLLSLLPSCDIHVAYGAVNLDELRRQPYASANPLDMAFRMCAQRVGDWLVAKAIHAGQSKSAFGLLIADECDKADKIVLQNSFRSMRKRVRPPEHDLTSSFLHDDMYFGDSRYSIGIQIADLCAYFIARQLSEDQETERFYKMIESQIFGGETGE